MKYMGFQIVFNTLKIETSCKPIGKMHFRLQFENQVLHTLGSWQNHKGNYGVSFNTKKAHIDGPKFL